eukprot:6455377-Amphidinium_carterae.1
MVCASWRPGDPISVEDGADVADRNRSWIHACRGLRCASKRYRGCLHRDSIQGCQCRGYPKVVGLSTRARSRLAVTPLYHRTRLSSYCCGQIDHPWQALSSEGTDWTDRDLVRARSATSAGLGARGCATPSGSRPCDGESKGLARSSTSFTGRTGWRRGDTHTACASRRHPERGRACLGRRRACRASLTRRCPTRVSEQSIGAGQAKEIARQVKAAQAPWIYLILTFLVWASRTHFQGYKQGGALSGETSWQAVERYTFKDERVSEHARGRSYRFECVGSSCTNCHYLPHDCTHAIDGGVARPAQWERTPHVGTFSGCSSEGRHSCGSRMLVTEVQGSGVECNRRFLVECETPGGHTGTE